MLADNKTPFSAIGFEHEHRDGGLMVVIAARGTFDLLADGKLQIAEQQALVLKDVFDGRPLSTPLVRAGDLIPFKPAADVTVLANAHSPDGRPAWHWPVGVSVDKTVDHVLRVHAPRAWKWNREGLLGRWKLDYTAKGATEVPLDYRYSFGGVLNGDPNVDGKNIVAMPDQRNPIGRGPIARDNNVKRDIDYPAAQIENPEEPLTDAQQRIEPEGFGPVPPWWTWRKRHVGTCDDDWTKMRAPRAPHDFKYSYFQVAHPNLVLPSYLKGGEMIKLTGLVPGGGDLRFHVPDITPWATFDFIDGRQVKARLHCDGLHIDLRQGPPWRVDLTWRAWMVSCPEFWKINLFQSTFAEVAHLPFSDEAGLLEVNR